MSHRYLTLKYRIDLCSLRALDQNLNSSVTVTASRGHFLWDNCADSAFDLGSLFEVGKGLEAFQVLEATVLHDVQRIGQHLAVGLRPLWPSILLPVDVGQLFDFLNALHGTGADEGVLAMAKVLGEQRHPKGVDVSAGMPGRERRLPRSDSHLRVPGASHRSLIYVGRSHQNVSVINDHHFRVNVDGKTKGLPENPSHWLNGWLQKFKMIPRSLTLT